MAGSIAKNVIKRAVKRGAVIASPFMPRPEASRILTYHSIGGYDHEMTVSTSAFMEQMAWVADNCAMLTLDEAATGTPGIAVTFDDGYQDNLNDAAPVLLRYEVPATVFMISGKAGELLDPHNDDGRIMTWDEVRALHKMGIAIGAHTVNHVRLAQLDREDQRAEIQGSVQRISEEIGEPVTAFAYPFGTAFDYTEDSKWYAKDAGCSVGVSNRYGVNPPGSDHYDLRRIWIDSTDSFASFKAKVQGDLDILATLDSKAGLRARRWLNRLAR